MFICVRLRLKCDGTGAETRFRLSGKRTSPFKPAGASVQSITGSRGVRISGSNVGYTMFRGSVESTGYPLHSPVSPSLPLPCVAMCHHISTGLYCQFLGQCEGLEFVVQNQSVSIFFGLPMTQWQASLTVPSSSFPDAPSVALHCQQSYC